MKKTSFLRSLALAGMVAVVSVGPAMARGDLEQQRRAASDAAYWQNKMADRSGDTHRVNATDGAMQGGNAARSDASPYPCAGCVYDNARGGYVFKPSLKR